MNHNKTILAIACAAALALPAIASADETGFAIQVGPTALKPANKSDAFSALGINFAADSISVSKKTIPEIDVFYGFTPNLVAQVVLTIPQSHTVSLAGVGDLGTFKQLPPTFLAQWHFLPGGVVDPYLGAGVNVTMIWGTQLSVAGNRLDLDHNSVGFAYQAGARFNIDKQMFVNLDYKHAALATNVYIGGATLTKVKVDPNLIGLAFGMHF